MPLSPRAQSAATSSRRSHDLLLLVTLAGLVLFGFVALAAATGWEKTLAAMAELKALQVSALLILSLGNYAARALRWHMFSGSLGLPLGVVANARHFLGGLAMSVTPGRVGELVRMRWIGRETGQAFERVAPLALIDRAADLSAMALLLAAGLMFSSTGLRGGAPVVMLSLILAFVATRPMLLKATAEILHRATFRRLPRLFARVRRASRSLAAFRAPELVGLAGLLGVIGWFFEAYAFHLLLSWMGADVELATAVAIFVFATLAGGLTGAPGGLGGAEAAMIALLLMQGVPPEIALPATLIIRVTTLWFAILVGSAIFPFAEGLSRKIGNGLERS